jgi:multicomponent Na+:H+ antiporter subunit D
MVLDILTIAGILSMVIGVLLAIGQWDFKRLLAYHSISQVGYVILGISLGTPLGILGGIFHLINHSVFKSLLFLNSGAVEFATGTRDLHRLGGLRKKMPVTAFTNLIASMSISGIPPFNGFWSKLIIVLACIQASHYWSACWAVFASIITLSSFLKIQKYVFLGPVNPELLKSDIKEVPASMLIPMVILSILCASMGLLLLPQARAVFLAPAADVLVRAMDYSKHVLGG